MMSLWIEYVYLWVFLHGYKASDLGVSQKGTIIPFGLIDKVDGAMTLQEWIDRLQDDGMVD
ncbi:hypothetical protein LCGC14_1719070 [marine sediment metagenome]|uniref:Uncharacterized protein n=1 Tax=marine sediment metagenome TaxID=412755 RepID=A0A0F9JTG1_9ZZZZ